MPTWGVGPAGFVAKPTAAIVSDIESAELAVMDPALDLSPTGPQGQLNGIVGNALSELWQLVGVAFNSNNRQAVEGAGLDNVGDEVGIPRETASYTQVYCDLVFTSGDVGNTYSAGTLVANVSGQASFTFSNYAALTVTAEAMNGVLMQAQTIGATTSVNPGTLSVITAPVSGWLTITNPAGQSQLGSNEELDANYAARQDKELAILGSCNPPAIVAALYQMAAAQTVPIHISVGYIENETEVDQAVSGADFFLPPHTFAVIAYDPTNWVAGSTGQRAVGAVIWANKPAGIPSIGDITVTITDKYLGQQSVNYTVPTSKPLYIVGALSIRTGYVFSAVSNSVQAALVAAATAYTPAGQAPPNGQLLPGGDVIGPQIIAIIMSVAGVSDVSDFAFDFTPAPSNTGPLLVGPTQIATMVAANMTFTQEFGP